MSLPLRPLPIPENWDCHGCGICCRGAVVVLNERDLERIGRQGWDQDPDFRGKAILVRVGLFDKRYRLAQRTTGGACSRTTTNCAGSTSASATTPNRTSAGWRPLQLVPLENVAYVTLRRYCPSAAADNGRSLGEQLDELAELLEQSGEAPLPSARPRLRRDIDAPGKTPRPCKAACRG